MYQLSYNQSLRSYNSFGIEAKADVVFRFDAPSDPEEFQKIDDSLFDRPHLVIGSGTNLLFCDDFRGVVILPGIGGIRITDEDDEFMFVEAGSGVLWDEFVCFVVGSGGFGAENLSLIPGKCGAAAIQNIGAYGVEVSSLIYSVTAYDLHEKVWRRFLNPELKYGYRDSVFKNEYHGRFIITSVLFKIRKRAPLLCDYGDLRKLKEIKDLTPQRVREEVIAIRSAKLPDPAIKGNAGSFFKNPVVSATFAAHLESELPGLPIYPVDDEHVKIAAGFLIDKAGWRGRVVGRAAVHKEQALVLTNNGGATGREIYALSLAIEEDILSRFGVRLEREVQVIGLEY